MISINPARTLATKKKKKKKGISGRETAELVDYE